MRERYLVQQVWCKRACGCSPVGVGGVDGGHEFAVGGAGGGKVLVAFLELETLVDDVLFKGDDPLFELLDVVGCAESGLAPGLLTAQVGQARLEVLGACGHAGVALLGSQEVGLQRGPADRRPAARGVWRLGLGGVELFEKVAVAVEEGAVNRAARAIPLDADLLATVHPLDLGDKTNRGGSSLCRRVLTDCDPPVPFPAPYIK
jgi:hypothetical protein